MAQPNDYVKKRTLYISIGVALFIGFLSGVVYSVYNAPAFQNQAASDPHDHEQESSVITSLELETQKNPDNVQAWVHLGHAYFDSEQYVKAITAYEKALTILPGDTNVMTDLGVMYRRNGQPDKAIATFDAVLKLTPEHEQARFNKGVVLLNDFNDKDQAIAEWRKLLENNPDAKAPSGSPMGELIKQIAESSNKSKRWPANTV